jgi:hypothetical protein
MFSPYRLETNMPNKLRVQGSVLIISTKDLKKIIIVELNPSKTGTHGGVEKNS